MSLLLDIANISGGLLLGLATLDKWDGESNFFNKKCAWWFTAFNSCFW